MNLKRTCKKALGFALEKADQLNENLSKWRENTRVIKAAKRVVREDLINAARKYQKQVQQIKDTVKGRQSVAEKEAKIAERKKIVEEILGEIFSEPRTNISNVSNEDETSA